MKQNFVNRTINVLFENSSIPDYQLTGEEEFDPVPWNHRESWTEE